MLSENSWFDKDGNFRLFKAGFGVIGIVVLLIAVFGSFYTVDAGERAIVLRFGQVVRTSDSGLHFKTPLIESIVTFDTRTQKDSVDDVQAASQDLQTVKTNVAVNYHVSPEDVGLIYQNIGEGFADKIISPAIQESVKATTAKYTAEQLITQRENVRTGIIDLLTGKLKTYHIVLDTVNITNFDFSPGFNQAIELKVTAEQNALAAKNKLDQVKYEAQQTVASAQGQAEAIRIQSDAIRNGGGEAYVQLQSIKVQQAAVEKWNGVLPTQMIPGSSVPFINVVK